MRLPPFVRRALPTVFLASAACSPPPPADPAIVAQWTAATHAVSRSVDPRIQARISALGALAMYEALAGAEQSPLQSLAGQVNGLWSIPRTPTRSIDGAIAAAEAQRVVLDSLLAVDSSARRAVDSLASAHVAARRASGVAEETASQSLAYGASIGRAVLALPADAQRTLVLRHAQECTLQVATRPASVVPQGEAAVTSAALPMPLLAAAESRIIEALAAADSAIVARRAVANDGECVRSLVRGRIRTRTAGR